MRLRVFQSDQGDCLLLTGDDGTRMLVDGGMRDSYTEHVAPSLARLARDGTPLDLVYVSHIDRDHISGVLELMDELVAWRVYDYQHAAGNASFAKPKRPRPPEVRRLWHNGFSDQIGRNAGAIEQVLAQSASVLEASNDEARREFAQRQRELATSVGEGIELSMRARPDQLDIPLNQEFGGRLAMVRDESPTVALGSLALTVLGPFERDLAALRREWNAWLRRNEPELDRIRRRMAADVEALASGQVEAFRSAVALQAKELGDRSRVTVPNLASLMLLAQENDTRVLLTGDGHSEDLLRGLARAGKLDGDALHVDVLKVQHHGSEHNIDEDFLRRVTADHYVFCANGAHENPDLDVLAAVVESRLGPRARRPDPSTTQPFKLWFNSSASATNSERNRRHMQEVERLVGSLANTSERKMRFAFLHEHFFEIRL